MGKPDQRELSENLAATEGLAHMIMECNRLFQVCMMSLAVAKEKHGAE